MNGMKWGRYVLAVLFLACIGGTVLAGQKLVQLSHTASLESPWNKASQLFAQYVNERLGDKYRVEVFGNGVLCQRNWKVMFEMTQNDESQIGLESTTTLGSLVPEIGAINLPFLFDDIEHVVRFIDSKCPAWEKWFTQKILAQDLIILASTPRPFRQLNNNRRIVKTPEDIKGLIFRVPSTPLFVKIFEALGAKPVPLSIGEVYTAIQLGTVAGEDNAISNQYDFKTHEVAKNFTIWNYIADLSTIFINREMWEAMPEADRKVFQDAADMWAKRLSELEEEKNVEAKEKMLESGVIFYEMSAAEKEPFKKLLQPVYDDFANQVGQADFAEFMEYVNKTKRNK